MAAILLHDTDVLRLSTTVNQARSASLIPSGGLLYMKGEFFQLMVTGNSTINYTVIAESSDIGFQARANIVSGLGAFALGPVLFIEGYFIQAFGDMAGSGGGGASLPDGDTVGQTISWDGAEWVPGVVPQEVLPAATIAGQVLTWDGTEWAVGDDPTTLPPGTVVGQTISWNGTSWAVGNVPQDKLSTSGTTNQVLTWNGSAWEPADVPKELPTTSTTGFVLTWNGSAWVGSAPSSGADATVWAVDGGIGIDAPTIKQKTLAGGQAIVVIDTAGVNGNVNILSFDGSAQGINISLLSMETATPVMKIQGPAALGSLEFTTTTNRLLAPGANLSYVDVQSAAINIRHGTSSTMTFATSGTAVGNGQIDLKVPYNSHVLLSATSAITTLRGPSSTGKLEFNTTTATLMGNTTGGIVEVTNTQVNLRHSQDANSNFTIGNSFTQLRVGGNNLVSYSTGAMVFGGGVLDTQMGGGRVRPDADNTKQLGSASFRWSEVFAGTGTINTSDGDHKTAPQAIPDAVLDAVGDVQFVQYKMLDAVALKGDEARLHAGVIAQQVVAAFAAHGLDAFAWGIVCYDEWEATPEVLDPITEEVLIEARAAGHLYSVRYDELQTLEMQRVRRELSRLLS